MRYNLNLRTTNGIVPEGRFATVALSMDEYRLLERALSSSLVDLEAIEEKETKPKQKAKAKK